MRRVRILQLPPRPRESHALAHWPGPPHLAMIHPPLEEQYLPFGADTGRETCCETWIDQCARSRRETREQKSEIAKFTLDIDRIIHYHLVVDRLGTTFAALSDPTRRAMIERLSHGPASVRGLTEPFSLSQQMISKHIAYLVRARIVIKTKRGRESVCTLRPEAIKTVSDWAV